MKLRKGPYLSHFTLINPFLSKSRHVHMMCETWILFEKPKHKTEKLNIEIPIQKFNIEPELF